MRPVGVPTMGADRRPVLMATAPWSTHVVGATGTGKSTVIAQFALADLSDEGGPAVVVGDPKGDLVNDLISRVPADRIEDVVLVDLGDPERLPSWNPLEVPTGATASSVVDAVTTVLMSSASTANAPRAEALLRLALMTLVGSGATLADVVPILTDRRTRSRHLAQCTDHLVHDGWTWLDDLPPAAREAAIAPVRWRVEALLAKPAIRNLVGAGPSSFDIGKILLTGEQGRPGILLVRAPRGTVGTDAAAVTLSLLVATVWLTVLGRSALDHTLRRPAFMHLDECHHALRVGDALGDILAEARGYGLGLVLAHQYLAQLGAGLRSAIAANARQAVYFRCSPEDASVLGRTIAPMDGSALTDLGPYEAAVRLMRGAEALPAFAVRTLPLMPPVPGRADEVRAASARRFGLSKADRRQRALRRLIRIDSGPSTDVVSWVGRSALPGVLPTSSQLLRGATPADENPDSCAQ